MGGAEAELLVVGGGASGTALLQALAAMPAPPTRRVILLERSSSLGPGYPYGETANPIHTMGRTPTLRREKGRQLSRRFEAALARVRALGVEVEVRTETVAHRLNRRGDGWVVETSSGDVASRRVVLAVGHWHVSRLAHLQRAVDWRWDERRLLAIPRHEEVIVLGMGQSGLDAAVSLALSRAGDPGAGRVILASRSGVLPGVFGFVSGSGASRSTVHLTACAAREHVRLQDLFEAAHADAEALAGQPLATWTLASLRAAIADVDPVALLRRELSRAQRSLQERRELPYQPVLWHGLEPFHEAMPKLSAEDRLALAANGIPVMRHAEAIHAGAAARLLDFIDRGVLQVVALGENVTVSEDASVVEARGERGAARGHRIVDCRGPDPRVALSDDAFLRSVLETGAAAPGRARFDRRPQPPAIPETWSIEHVGDEDWLITGGLWVDPQTFAVRDVRGEPHGLFALGPLTIGQFPFYAGLWASRRGAQRIVASLGKG